MASLIGSKKKYIKYSDEQIKNVRETDMLDFLGRKEGFTFQKQGSVFVCNQHDSLIVQADRQRWYWNSQDTKGLNCIDWLMKIDGYEWQEAMQTMCNVSTVETFKRTETAKKEQEKVEKQIIVPEKTTSKFNQTFAYLTKTRCIAPQIVNFCFKEHYIYQDIKGNCVFAGYDEQGEIKFAETKITNSYNTYRPRNVSGSDKNYSFNLSCLNGNSKNLTVYVFEAPVDLLSHATMTLISEQKKAETENRTVNINCWQEQNRLSLSGCSDVALNAYLHRYPQIKNIVLCLDNDDAGKEAIDNISKKYGNEYNISVHHAKNGKDYNEALQSYTATLLILQKAEKANLVEYGEKAVSNKPQLTR